MAKSAVSRQGWQWRVTRETAGPGGTRSIEPSKARATMPGMPAHSEFEEQIIELTQSINTSSAHASETLQSHNKVGWFVHQVFVTHSVVKGQQVERVMAIQRRKRP